MAATTSSLPIVSSAFITEADAQDFVGGGGVIKEQRHADAIIKAINWSTGQMEQLTGRRLKGRPYTIKRNAYVDSRVGTLIPLDATATAYLIAVQKDEPVVSSVLPAYCHVSSTWDGSKVAVTPSGGTGDATDTVTLGQGRLTERANDHKEVNLSEWPLNTLTGIYLLAPDGTRQTLDITNAIIDYDTAHIRLASDFFTHWDDEWRNGQIEVECNAGYLEPAAGTLGHPMEFSLLAQIQRELVSLSWQRFLTPASAFSTVNMGDLSGTPSNFAVPGVLRDQLEPFSRRNR